VANITVEQCDGRQSKVYKKLDRQEIRAEERHSELLVKISRMEGAHSSSTNWAGYIVPILAAILAAWLASALAGCTTTKTDAAGKPQAKGKYTTTRLCGVTVSRKPLASISAKADAAIMRWLLIAAGIGFIGLIVGAISWYLDKAGKFPCPWWDEVVVGAGLVLCMALLSIFIYPYLKWIVLGGLVAFAGYRVVKEFRSI